MSIESHYIACVRKRPTYSQGTTNRTTTTYTSTNIMGYLGSQTDRIVYIADKATIETIIKFFTNDFSILKGDLVVYEGNTYETIGLPKNTGHRNDHIRIMVKLINQVKQ